MAEHLDIPIDQTSKIRYEFQAFAIDGTPMDLTTATDIVLTMKRTLADKTPFATLSVTTGNIAITDAVNGLWIVTFNTPLTAPWPSVPMVYDIYVVYGPIRYRACQGSILINTTVTGL